MTIAAKTVIQKVTELLQDTTSIRWPVPDLVGWLNTAQRDVFLNRPDLFNKSATVTLAAGARQTLPADAVKLIEVYRNDTASSKKAVRYCEKRILNDQIPGWQGLDGKPEVVHFMYDPREPKVFWVYPPATADAALLVNYATLPTDLPIPVAGSTFADVTGNISVPDQFEGAMIDFVLFRCYAKDSEYAGDPTRSTAFYSSYANALGIDIKATVAVGPKTSGNAAGA